MSRSARSDGAFSLMIGSLADPAPQDGGPPDPGPAPGPYLEARSREGRLYPDAIVTGLPAVPRGHPLEREWRQRADSSARLVDYLRRRRPSLVVDAGCGNGWLSARLAQVPGTRVVGTDVNAVELAQAARVFRAPNLAFVRGDVLAASSPVEPADVVVLASVIQYAPDFQSLIGGLLGWLVPGGELHVLDSPLYAPREVAAARERTRRHYASLGVPEMALAYHHHCWQDLAGVAAEVLYRPDSTRRRIERRLLRRDRSPFPWLRIRAPAAVRR